MQRLDKKILQIWVTSLVNIWKRNIVPFCTGPFSTNHQSPSAGGRPSSLQVGPPFCLEEQAIFQEQMWSFMSWDSLVCCTCWTCLEKRPSCSLVVSLADQSELLFLTCHPIASPQICLPSTVASQTSAGDCVYFGSKGQCYSVTLATNRRFRIVRRCLVQTTTALHNEAPDILTWFCKHWLWGEPFRVYAHTAFTLDDHFDKEW